jgi:hypothetical protein
MAVRGPALVGNPTVSRPGLAGWAGKEAAEYSEWLGWCKLDIRACILFLYLLILTYSLTTPYILLNWE